MDFGMFASKPARPARKTDADTLTSAWLALWDGEVRAVLSRSRRMKWGALEDALDGSSRQRKKAARAVQNLFVCWSAAHPGTPIWPVLAGTPESRALELLAEFQLCPPPRPRTTRFLWKDNKHPAPEVLGEFGRLGADVWQTQLAEAELRAIQILRENLV